jgi:hypothetical protein
MRKLFLVAFFCSLSLSAAIVNVVDTLYQQDGTTGANGSLLITWPTFYGHDGHLIVASSTTYQVVNGVVNLNLESTLDSTPTCRGTTVGCAIYTVTYSIVGQTPHAREYWSVPSSPGTQPIKNLRVLNPGPNGPLVPNVQIITGGSGAAIGSVVTGGTAKSVLFVDGSNNLGQDNGNFAYDPVTHSLGLGTNTPGRKFESTASIRIDGDIWFNNPENYRLFTPAGSGNFSTQPQANGVGNHFALYPTTGTLPTDTLGEFIVNRMTTADEAIGNFERLDIAGWVTPCLCWAIQGEKGGTGQFRPLLIENGPNESIRFNTDMSIYVGLGSNPSLDTTWQIMDPITAGAGAGTYDSHKINLVGYGSNGSVNHNASWRLYDNVTSQAGASTFRLQSRIDAGAFTDRFTVTDTGIVSWPGSPVTNFITPMQAPYNCVGDGTTDDTACVASAVNAASGKTVLIDRFYAIKGISAWTASNVSVQGLGYGTGFKISPGAAGTAYVSIAGTTGATTTTTTNLPFASRFTAATKTINVASAAGISVGGTLGLTYCDNFPTCGGGAIYIYSQTSLVQTVSGTAISFTKPIIIPLLTTHTGNVQIISPVKGVKISNLTFDGSGTNGGATAAYGLVLTNIAESVVEGVNFTGFNIINPNGGLVVTNARDMKYENLYGINCGSGQTSCMGFTADTNSTHTHIRLEGDGLTAQDGFGYSCGSCVWISASDISAAGFAGRAWKIQNTAYSTYTNISSDGSTNKAQFAVFNGNYRNSIRSGTAMESTTSVANAVGFEMFGAENAFNLVDGFNSFGNGNIDFYVAAGIGGASGNNHDNLFHNISVGTLQIEGGGNHDNTFTDTAYTTLTDTSGDVTNRVGLKAQFAVAKGIIGTSGLPDSLLEIRNSTGGAASVALSAGTLLHLVGADTVSSGIQIDTFAGAGEATPTLNFQVAQGTIAAKTALNQFTLMGSFTFNGWNGSAYATGANFECFADQIWTGSHQGTRCRVNITPDNSASVTTGAFTFWPDGSSAPIAQNLSALTACTATNEGAIASIKDSTTNTWGATITGGSTNHVMGYCDGSAWTVMAK